MLLTSNLSLAYGNYDHIEYAGIWIIALVMTVWGMTAAMIAGVIAALSTYAVQVST
jgi:SulP family sulfate permease